MLNLCVRESDIKTTKITRSETRNPKLITSRVKDGTIFVKNSQLYWICHWYLRWILNLAEYQSWLTSQNLSDYLDWH